MRVEGKMGSRGKYVEERERQRKWIGKNGTEEMRERERIYVGESGGRGEEKERRMRGDRIRRREGMWLLGEKHW